MCAPRTAEEAFAAYVLLRAASPRGWDGPDAGRRPTTPQGGTHQALHLLVSEPDQAGLHPVHGEGSPDELRRIDGKDPGPAERHNLPPVPATVLGQATRQRAGRP